MPCRELVYSVWMIGIIASYIAEKVTSSDHGLLTNLLVGIAGRLRRQHARQCAEHPVPWLARQLILASIGAVLVLWIWRGPADCAQVCRHPNLLDRSDGVKAPAPSGKARLPTGPCASPPGSGVRRQARVPSIRRARCARAAATVWGGVPGPWRMLGQTPRHLHADGRHRTGLPSAVRTGRPGARSDDRSWRMPSRRLA